MSADNTIAILKTKDGYRVAHCQALGNIYWHHSCCDNPDVEWKRGVSTEDIEFYKECLNCGTLNPKLENRNEINPSALKDYFGYCKVFKTEEEAFKEAEKLYKEIIEDDYLGIVEYGITNIYYDKEFPNGR